MLANQQESTTKPLNAQIIDDLGPLQRIPNSCFCQFILPPSKDIFLSVSNLCEIELHLNLSSRYSNYILVVKEGDIKSIK